jgi:hypothetical protein
MGNLHPFSVHPSLLAGPLLQWQGLSLTLSSLLPLPVPPGVMLNPFEGGFRADDLPQLQQPEALAGERKEEGLVTNYKLHVMQHGV